MPKSKTTRRVFRPGKQNFAESAEFPQWLFVAEVVGVGFILVLVCLSDAKGGLSRPGVGSMLFLIGIVGAAVLLIWTHRGTRRKRRRHTSGRRGERGM